MYLNEGQDQKFKWYIFNGYGKRDHYLFLTKQMRIWYNDTKVENRSYVHSKYNKISPIIKNVVKLILVTNLNIYLFSIFQAKQRASIKWLLSKAYEHKTPAELREPFYKDNDVSIMFIGIAITYSVIVWFSTQTIKRFHRR